MASAGRRPREYRREASVATLLSLGASVSQLPAIRYARSAGHRVIAVDGDHDALGFQIADACINVDFTDVDNVVAAVRALGVDGVLAISSDRAVLPAAEIAHALGLPGIGADVALAMTDKTVMRARLETGGVPQPKHAVLTRDSDVSAVTATIPLPAVLKPADSGGQRGLFRIDEPADVERRLHETLSFSPSGQAMLEEFVDGIELNGILAVRKGEPLLLTLSDRLRPPGLGFGVGWIHMYPSSLDADVLERARHIAYDAVRVLGLRDGIAFPQLIADDGDVRLVEIAARIAAGQMADLVRFGTGIELFDIAIAQALGRPVLDEFVTPTSQRPIAIRFLTASPGVLPLGTVAAVEGLDEVRSSPGVLAAGLYFDAGATITPVQVDADRRGYVVATAETADAALALADNAARKLVVRTIPKRRAFRQARVLVPVAGAALAAAAAAVALVAFDGGIRPRLVSDTIRGRGAFLQVRYAFNEPVRALLLVNGKAATAVSPFRKSGALLWQRRRGRANVQIAIEGTDRSGRRAIVRLSRARDAASARHPVAT
jgi:biotin carboxylase